MKGKMTKGELKELIVELRLQLISMNIGKGRCPYSFYSVPDREEDCGVYSCSKCKDIFFRRMRARIEKEVAAM